MLKQGTSVEKPTFILQGVSPFDWNVAYCETFGRYYFINDVTYVESTYEISCTCDYLASYRDAILANTAYVTRSASLFDEELPDTLFPPLLALPYSKHFQVILAFLIKVLSF